MSAQKIRPRNPRRILFFFFVCFLGSFMLRQRLVVASSRVRTLGGVTSCCHAIARIGGGACKGAENYHVPNNRIERSLFCAHPFERCETSRYFKETFPSIGQNLLQKSRCNRRPSNKIVRSFVLFRRQFIEARRRKLRKL